MTEYPNNRLNILFLPRWYPNRYDPMSGLFIEQLAKSLSRRCNVYVLYLHPDPDCPSIFETDFAEEHGVDVIRVYFQPGSTFLQKWFRFYAAFLNGLKILGSFSPDVIHAHVLTRHGVLAYLASRRYHKPFVISEHWSRYFPESTGFIGIIRKWGARMIVRKANALIPVSESLGNAMHSHGLINPRTRIIPNAIDTVRFDINYQKEATQKIKVVHISCFDDRSKNISGLLEVLKKVTSIRSDFVCNFIGDGADLAKMKSTAEKMGLTGTSVVFKGLLENERLVEELSSADFSVLSSRYETFGTVVIESLACGVPVLATQTGIVPGLVDKELGIVVKPGDTNALEMGFLEMLDKCRDFDKQILRASVVKKFSDATVTDTLWSLYNEVIDTWQHD